ncbi:MAG TPA: DUF2892 domain-containing protein [Longimicrobium sp.]|nr:DUF2892 domain-containing protein [Longimicrobium sp.]
MRIPTNESPLDRTLRIVVGTVLGWLYLSGYVTGWTAAVALVFSVLLLFTGIVGYCPVYALFRTGTASGVNG